MHTIRDVVGYACATGLIVFVGSFLVMAAGRALDGDPDAEALFLALLMVAVLFGALWGFGVIQ